MQLPFLDRDEELSRIKGLIAGREGSLGVLYGRRRCGKSRLIRESLPSKNVVYYVGDDRESVLQKEGVALEMARIITGFNEVTYPTWDILLQQWWNRARSGAVLILDEFPSLVTAARELPSLLQKILDSQKEKGIHLILCGSSQRMMHGLILDRNAPLFGRAHEILKIKPLPAGYIKQALGMCGAVEAVEAYAVWGGIPRYWELAADHSGLVSGIRNLVLSPLGVLHDEPKTLLLDDIRDPAQASSILNLIGRGCHRVSEIAGRLGKPSTAIYRPLQRLVEMDLIRRDVPYGSSVRDTKRTLYRIADPFIRFWFRFVEPNRSRLEAAQIEKVASEIEVALPLFVSGIWEELARASVSRMALFGRSWKPAGCWWGSGLDRKSMELDIVAESDDGSAILIGEAKWSQRIDERSLIFELRKKGQRFPLRKDKKVFLALWLKKKMPTDDGIEVITPTVVLQALR